MTRARAHMRNAGRNANAKISFRVKSLVKFGDEPSPAKIQSAAFSNLRRRRTLIVITVEIDV